MPILVLVTIISLIATLMIRPSLLENYQRAPVLYIIPALVSLSLFILWRMRRINNERGAFLSSCSYLLWMLVGAAVAVYPNLLLSSTDPLLNITVYSAHSGDHSLAIGLIWWIFGIAIAVGYFVFVYRMFRGKITGAGTGH